MSRIRYCIIASVACVLLNAEALAQSSFELAERRLASCASRADLHPPFIDKTDIMAACHPEADVYIIACAERRNAFECSFAAVTLVHSIWKLDPVDEAFINCLDRSGRPEPFAMELLTLCPLGAICLRGQLPPAQVG